MGWYERVISMDGKLQGKARSHRRLLFIINAWALPLTVALSFGSERWPTRFVVSWASCLLYAVMLGLCICRVPISNTLLRAEVALWAVFIAIMDLDLRAVGSQPVWPWFVLLADLSLVIGLGRRFTNWLIGLAAVWVTVCDLEKVYRFGLFDLPGTAPGWHRAERFSQSTSCTDYPCRVSLYTGTHEIITSVFVLIVAYIATRGFADAAEKEKAAMARTIETVEAIAQLLAGYDVDTVAEMLQEAEAEGRLPAAMHEALQRLEQNLRAYRPYLPKSCLPVGCDGSDGADTPTQESDSVRSTSIPDQIEKQNTNQRNFRMLRHVTRVQATLLVVNTHATLECLERDPRVFSEHFEHVLSTVMSQVETRRGLVDVFIGDRILASFNTSRTCMVHAPAAASAAKQIMRTVGKGIVADTTMRINIGAATGRVHCGDMGCAEMRRFSLLGTLPMLACGMERAARAFGIDILCNTVMQREAEHEQVLLLVPRLVRLVKATACGREVLTTAVAGEADKSSHPVYELWDDGAVRVDTVPQHEWIYEIGKGAAHWALYNTAIRSFITGSSVQHAVDTAGDHAAVVTEKIRLLGQTTPLVVHM